MIFIGLDPGKSGGIASISEEGILHLAPMPEAKRDVLDWMLRWNPDESVAIIELVGGYLRPSGDEGGGNIGSAMFEFGKNVGNLEMAVLAAGFVEGVNFTAVHPATWQKAVGVPRRGEKSKGAHKNKLKERAKELFPEAKVTLKTADALLIAYYAREVARRDSELLEGLK